jgi:hypothetical protein
MGRTVVSQITMAHLFGTSVTCLYEGDTLYALGQKRVRFPTLIFEFRIKISMEIDARLTEQILIAAFVKDDSGNLSGAADC